MAGHATRALAVTLLASLALAACSSNDDVRKHRPTGDGRGGTLTYYLEKHDIDSLDPQRVYNGVAISALGRTVYRSWLAFPASEDPGKSTTSVADLATDLGRPSPDAKTWQFTLREGARWQDGKPVTCEDFKYGASRPFATDTIKDGATYIVDYLDLPTDPSTHRPIYTGPYHHSKEGQAAFDRAITCDGPTITYRFNKPWADFPLAIAGLHMMDPYRKDQDHRADSAFRIFSNGPYKLEGAWDKKTGGRLVRNDQYDATTDLPELRRALPDTIDFVLDKTAEQITDLLTRDRGRDRAAISAVSVPNPGDLTGAAADRAVRVPAPYVGYLLPNVRRLTNVKVREALAASTDASAWVAADGSHRRLEEGNDVLPPEMRGYRADLFPGGAGDPVRAKRLLEEAGVATPYPITFSYPTLWATARQAAALAHGWEQGGFAVTVDAHPHIKEYFENMALPDHRADVLYAAWGADWPSAMTVIPPLFDSRPNLTESSNGNDFGGYRSEVVEDFVDQAQQSARIDAQTVLMQQADQQLVRDIAYIPLTTLTFNLLRGSAVRGYVNTAASSGFPDLGPIGVQ